MESPAAATSPPSNAGASPAPFLAQLRAPRPVAPVGATNATTVPVAPAPRVQPAASSDDLDALSDAPLSDESFESATTVVSRAVLAHRDVERGDDATPISAARPPPPLDDMVARIPAETKEALEQLFRARFRAVRRITREQLR